MKDPKEEQWYFINITDIGPSSVSYFDVHDFDIYYIFVCVLHDSEINTNKQTKCSIIIPHYPIRLIFIYLFFSFFLFTCSCFPPGILLLLYIVYV